MTSFVNIRDLSGVRNFVSGKQQYVNNISGLIYDKDNNLIGDVNTSLYDRAFGRNLKGKRQISLPALPTTYKGMFPSFKPPGFVPVITPIATPKGTPPPSPKGKKKPEAKKSAKELEEEKKKFDKELKEFEEVVKLITDDATPGEVEDAVLLAKRDKYIQGIIAYNDSKTKDDKLIKQILRDIVGTTTTALDIQRFKKAAKEGKDVSKATSKVLKPKEEKKKVKSTGRPAGSRGYTPKREDFISTERFRLVKQVSKKPKGDLVFNYFKSTGKRIPYYNKLRKAEIVEKYYMGDTPASRKLIDDLLK